MAAKKSAKAKKAKKTEKPAKKFKEVRISSDVPKIRGVTLDLEALKALYPKRGVRLVLRVMEDGDGPGPKPKKPKKKEYHLHVPRSE